MQFLPGESIQVEQIYKSSLHYEVKKKLAKTSGGNNDDKSDDHRHSVQVQEKLQTKKISLREPPTFVKGAIRGTVLEGKLDGVAIRYSLTNRKMIVQKLQKQFYGFLYIGLGVQSHIKCQSLGIASGVLLRMYLKFSGFLQCLSLTQVENQKEPKIPGIPLPLCVNVCVCAWVTQPQI
ncbi:hypothetical protein RUM43_011221 [Polyplax serrata]|uniref:Uncharacterized protein n=1 Tax=Polyplax serrata TaxID=468196 RepID=A0AAN8P8T1_POLSC